MQRIDGRRVDAAGIHSFHLHFPVSANQKGPWIERSELLEHIEFNRKQLKRPAPARKIPCLVPVRGFPCPDLSQQWIADHPLVGTIATLFLTTTTAAWDAHKRKDPKSRPRRTSSQRPLHSVRIEAVLPGASAATTECWGRAESDLTLPVTFTW